MFSISHLQECCKPTELEDSSIWIIWAGRCAQLEELMKAISKHPSLLSLAFDHSAASEERGDLTKAVADMLANNQIEEMLFHEHMIDASL
jgi:hypothetical protein